MAEISTSDSSGKENNQNRECSNGYELENDIINMSLKENDFELPSYHMAEKIRNLVEYLFCDSNILKDKFLLKHIRRNKEGYVSLKLISSLRKVKALTKNWRIVAYSLEKSQKLQMNEDKTKIRRLDPLPKFKDEVSNKRNCLILELPPNIKSSDDVKNQLTKFGNIVSVTIIESDSDAVKIHSERITSSCKMLPSFPYAVVEFENFGEIFSDNRNLLFLGKNCQIVPFANGISDDKIFRSPFSSPNSNHDEIPKLEGDGNIGNGGRSKSDVMASTPSPASSEEYTIPSSRRSYQCKKRQDDSRNFETMNNSLNTVTISSVKYGRDGIVNKWTTQRRQLSKGTSVIILRQPRGPDGTIGFHAGRSKANLLSPKTTF